MTDYFAHSENSQGIKHDLVEHLTSVARRASEFAAKFGAGEGEGGFPVRQGRWISEDLHHSLLKAMMRTANVFGR